MRIGASRLDAVVELERVTYPGAMLLPGLTDEILARERRWLAPEHRYFKVRGEDGATYILRHDVPSGAWDMVSFVSAQAGAPMTARPSSGVRPH